MRASMRTKLILVIKGMAMGAADVIPGVSGGTVAFVTGIYETLIDFLSSIGKQEIKSIFLILLPKTRSQAKEVILNLNWGFIIPLGIGIVISILSLSKIIVYIMETFPVQTYAFFFGLILFSVKFPYDEMKKELINFIIILITAFSAFLFFSITGEAHGSTDNLLYVFICGAIAICALILPGISGSTFLVILGMYKPILNAVHNRDLLTVGVFMAGMTVGILSFVRVLKWLLHRYHSYTMAGLTGLMIGSLKKVWPFTYADSSVHWSHLIVPVGGFIILGVVLVYILDFVSKPKTLA